MRNESRLLLASMILSAAAIGAPVALNFGQSGRHPVEPRGRADDQRIAAAEAKRARKAAKRLQKGGR